MRWARCVCRVPEMAAAKGDPLLGGCDPVESRLLASRPLQFRLSFARLLVKIETGVDLSNVTRCGEWHCMRLRVLPRGARGARGICGTLNLYGRFLEITGTEPEFFLVVG